MKKEGMFGLGFVLFSLLLLPSAFGADDSGRFLSEFSLGKHVYDYAGILPNAAALEAQLAELPNAELYVVTFGEGSDIEQVKSNFRFEQEETISIQETPLQVYSPTSGEGTIRTYRDVQCSSETTCENTWRSTGLEPCWPERASNEKDWRAIWEEHACMEFPETFERISLNFDLMGEQREGRYEISIPTNALLGEVYIEGGMWRFKDREGYVYDLAPSNRNDPVYNWLNRVYNDPEYSVFSVRESTLTHVLHEKYGALNRLSGGSKGYLLPVCTDTNRRQAQISGVDEGSSTKLTGYATATAGNCKVIIFYENNGELIVGASGCRFKSSDVVDAKTLKPLVDGGRIADAINEIIRAVNAKVGTATADYALPDCTQQSGRAKALLDSGRYNDALDEYETSVKICTGLELLISRYRIAEINYYLKNYKEASRLAGELFTADNYIVAKAALRIMILCGREQNDCSEVERVYSIWQEGNYGEDKAVDITVSMCRQNLPGHGPRIKDPLTKILEQKQEVFLQGDYAECIVGLTDSYNYALASDTEIARGFIELIIRSSIGLGDCVSARDYYSAYNLEFPFSEQLDNELKRCGQQQSPIAPPFKQTTTIRQTTTTLISHSSSTSIFSNQQSTTTTSTLVLQVSPQTGIPDSLNPFTEITNEGENIEKIMNTAWGLYNKGDFKRGFGVSSELILQKFENEPSNKQAYASFYKSGKKLQLLCLFGAKRIGNPIDPDQNCDYIYTSYYPGFREVFGVDSDIENSYQTCKGGRITTTTINAEITSNTRPGTSTKLTTSTLKDNTPLNIIPVSNDLCKNKWPTTEGSLIHINSKISSCSLFETGNPDMDWIIKEAGDCCIGNEFSSQCDYAKSHSTLSDQAQNLKRCIGIYIIEGLGTYAQYMKGYFWPESNCMGNDGEYLSIEPEYSGKCDSSNFYSYNQFARALPCRPDRSIVWESDTDMSKNNCNLVDVPSHVSLNILKTGTCVDYSVAVTTLLRRAGYAANEVFTVTSNHAINYVLLPGDSKYHIVDTNGNGVGIVFGGVFPSRDYQSPYLEKSCSNDKGYFKCPDKSMIMDTYGGNAGMIE